MTPAHSVLLTIGLFGLTFLSPGPNLLIVVQSSLSSGRAAGIAAGLGVATGDAIYAGLGLFGMAALIAQSGDLFAAVRIAGGLYLLWLAWRAMKGGPAVVVEDARASSHAPAAGLFARGLVTDLANPQTVLFFASIFAVTLTPTTPAWAKALSWLGIVVVSAAWRCMLSVAFSRRRVRAFYARSQRAIERAAGAAFAVFGTRLIADGISAT